MKNKKIIVTLIISFFLLSTTTSEAGPLSWAIKGGKKAWEGVKHAAVATTNVVESGGKMAYSLSTIIIAGATINELQAYPVQPEIEKAIDNGAYTYQTRVCDTPEGTVAVPEFVKVCFDGSPVSYGETISLSTN